MGETVAVVTRQEGKHAHSIVLDKGKFESRRNGADQYVHEVSTGPVKDVIVDLLLSQSDSIGQELMSQMTALTDAPSFTVFLVVGLGKTGRDTRALSLPNINQVAGRLRSTYYWYLDPR